MNKPLASDEAVRLQQALEHPGQQIDPLQQVRAWRESRLAACAVRGAREIAHLQQATASGTRKDPAASSANTPETKQP